MKYFFSWICIFLFTSIPFIGSTQCFSFTESEIAPNSSFVVPLIIDGAVFNDLSTIDQCVEAVSLSFSHPRVSELEFFLISPFGDTISLVSGSGGTFSATNNTNWNITFLPCSETAFPDNDFNPNFTNTDNWGVFGNYFGLYYPFEGCLEDFNQGPVNGTWQLLIRNNSAFNSGSLTGFSVFFCNSEGLDCFICQATQSTISISENSFCAGSDDLLLDIQRTFVGMAPDPTEYAYDYLLFQDSFLLYNGPVIDLRDSTSGNFTVCGLSYLEDDTLALPNLGEKINFDSFRMELTSDTATFCGKLSNCFNIEINPPIDTTFFTAFICEGDTLFIGNDTLLTGGIFDVVYDSNTACDSIVQVNLQVFEIDIQLENQIVLSCAEPEAMLTPVIISSNVNADSFLFSWTGPDGNLLSNEDSLQVSEPGLYELTIRIEFENDTLCEYRANYNVILANETYEPSIEVPGLLCPDSIYTITLDTLLPGTQYTWSISTDHNIIGPSDSSILTFIPGTSNEIEICVQLENDCFELPLICDTTLINYPNEVEISFQDTICGSHSSFDIAGLSDFDLILIDGPSTALDFNIVDSIIMVEVSESGLYELSIAGLNNGCPFDSVISVYFIVPPDISFSVQAQNDCISPLITIQVTNPDIANFNLFGAYNNISFNKEVLSIDTIFIFNELIIGSNSVTLDSIQYSAFPSCTFNLSEQFEVLISPTIAFPENVTTCNDTLGGNESVLDFSQLFNVPVNILSIELIDFEGDISIPLVNFNNITPAVYSFNVSFDPEGNCPPIDTIIMVEVVDCSCPFLELGNIVYDFCLADSLLLNTYVTGDWVINWELVLSPEGSLLNIVEDEVIFEELQSGMYEFAGSIENAPDGCDSTISLMLNGLDSFVAGNPIQEDTIIICLQQGDQEINLFDYIQNYDSTGLWSITAIEGMAGSLEPVNGIFILTEFGKANASFRYDAPENVLCSDTPIDLHFIIYKEIGFTIPEQLFISCDENEIDIDISPYLDIPGWRFEIDLLSGSFEYFNNDRSILIDSESQLRFTLTNETESCLSEYDLTVSFSSPPIDQIDIDIIKPICDSDLSGGEIIINEIIGGTAPFITRIGNDTINSTPFIFSNLIKGLYQLEIKDSNGCRFDSLIIIDSDQQGFISLGDDIIISAGENVEIDFDTDLEEDEIINTEWLLDGDVVCTGCLEVMFPATSGQELILIVTDINECIYIDTLRIFVDNSVPFYIPNAFTPTANGINDVLYLYPRGGLVEVLEWKIFDRWGTTVFDSGPFDPFTQEIGWDGSFRGRTVVTGTYISSVKYVLNNGRSVYYVSEITVLN